VNQELSALLYKGFLSGLTFCLQNEQWNGN
jgi:hypothetical protein